MSSTDTSGNTGTTGTSVRPRTVGRRVWGAGARAALLAAAANTLVWLVGQLTPATWLVSPGGRSQEVFVVLPALASLVRPRGRHPRPVAPGPRSRGG